jgi:hypothetical protein
MIGIVGEATPPVIVQRSGNGKSALLMKTMIAPLHFLLTSDMYGSSSTHKTQALHIGFY